VVGRQILAGFEAGTVRALLHAACSSPTAVHHLPILADLLAQSYAFPPRGARSADLGDLSRWINTVRAEVPGVTAKDDWIPCDPRLIVRTRIGGRRRPVHPGLLSRPHDLYPTVLEYAECIDPLLVGTLGFGLSDVAELAMRIMEVERLALGPHWTGQRPTDPADPARVSRAEVQAAEQLLAGWADHANDTGLPVPLLIASHESLESDRRQRLVAAFAWCTREAVDIVVQPGWLLRGALFVRHNGQVAPAPAGVVMDSLAAATLALVKQATANLKQTNRRRAHPKVDGATDPASQLLAIAKDKVVMSLRGLPAHIFTGAATDGGPEITALIAPGGRHLVAVQVLADIDPKALSRAVDRGHKQLRRLRPGNIQRLPHFATADDPGMASPNALPFAAGATTPAGTYAIRSDVEIRRVTLVAGPWAQPRLRRRGVVTMTVDEWCDLVAQSGEDPEEFWAFVDELAELPGVRVVEAFELRDLWTVFDDVGLLYLGGDEAGGLVVPPRDCTLEWHDAAQADGVNEVLDRLDLPALNEWPLRSPVRDGVATVSCLQPTRHVLINAAPALAVDTDPGTGEDFDPGLAFMVAEAIRDGVTQLSERAAEPDSPAAVQAGWAAWQTATSDDATLVQLVATPRSHDKEPIWFAGIAPNAFLIGYDRRQFAQLSTQDVQNLVGSALAEAIAARIAITASAETVEPVEPGVVDGRALLAGAPQAVEAAQAFTHAWSELSPTIRVGHRHNVVFAPPGGPGSRVSVRARHRAERRLAQALVRAAVPAQQVTGAEASQLLMTTVCPAALDVLLDDLAQFEPTVGLTVVAREVERVWAERSRLQTQRTAREVARWDPTVTDGDPIEDTITCRAADLVIEAMLHTPPRGTAMLDHRDWERLLLEAALCLELSGRATANTVGLDRIAVDLADTGACRTGVISSRIDMLAYHDARLAIHQHRDAQQLHNAAHLDAEECVSSDAGEGGPQRWTTVLGAVLADPERPSYERPVVEGALAADQAMREHLYTGIDEIKAVLMVAASWSGTTGTGEVIDITRDQLIQEVADWADLDAAAVAAAVDLLTLTPVRLEEEGLSYWELERRSGRLATRPLLASPAAAGDRQILLLPRRIAATQHIFANYALGGRLPWPPHSLPPAVTAAYEAWQQAGQGAFEIHLEEVVRDHGFTHCRRGLKETPAARMGIRLTGEIDLLLADPHRGRLWVIEAKDAQVPFGLNQILYEITDYHGVTPETAPPGRFRFKTPERAYIGKLLTKTDDVRQQLVSVLGMLGINDDSRPWQVIPLIVTPSPVAASFAAEPKVAFTCPEPLPGILTTVDLPRAGYHG
jgi:hypothetical protein